MKTWLSPRIKLLITLAGLLIAIQIVNSLSGYSLVSFGIQPRTTHGLVGIIFAPLIHGDWAHLLSNLPPLLILSALLLHDSIRKYAYASAFIIVIGGAIVWLIGRHALHIGASGWCNGKRTIARSSKNFHGIPYCRCDCRDCLCVDSQ